MIDDGISFRGISRNLSVSRSSLQYWLDKYGFTKVKQKPCKQCGTNISKRRKFCSTVCHKNNVRQNFIKDWLEKGNIVTKGNIGNYIRTYISNNQNDKCIICGLKQIWNGKKIVFVLDHIDGNHENNNRKNLRLVCPNCDSQLDTYKSKNKGNGRFYRKKRYQNGKSY